MSEVMKAKQAVTVPMADGRTVALDRGDSVDVSETTEAFQNALKVKDGWAQKLFEKGKASESTTYGADDPNTRSFNEVEELSQARAAAHPNDRAGFDPGVQLPPVRGDAGRTRPESGADWEADERYAAGTDDTSEPHVERPALHGDTPEAAGLELPDIPVQSGGRLHVTGSGGAKKDDSVADGAQAGGDTGEVSSAMSRDELDKIAKGEGLDPDDYGNKDDLAAAINQKRAGG